MYPFSLFYLDKITPGLYHEWTIKAAQAGKHILCEKPLALNGAECAEMDAAARQNSVLLIEAFMYRFHPQTERVIELIRQGAIGEPRLIHAAFACAARPRCATRRGSRQHARDRGAVSLGT